jgi:uncharacterized protein (TIGR03067 family)
MRPPPGFPPGRPGPADGEDEKKEEDKPEDGKITVDVKDKTLLVSLELKWPQSHYEIAMRTLEVVVPFIKGQADLAVSRPRVHELAAASQAFLKEKGHFPQGALHRSPSSERGIDWRPDQRLSWVVELLPYLGDEYKGWSINRNLAWNEGVNRVMAMRLVPHLLGRRQDKLEPWIDYPNLDGKVAATYVVGMAGVGLDAAEYKSGDAAVAAKLGVFGYDRITRKSDIKDRPDQTIVFIQVPADHKSPWLMAGGATLRGVSEDDDALQPFVCTTWPGKPGVKPKLDGKKGTVAVMADGKVRFIPADLPAATFRALCTIAGGEKVDKFDELCPVIPADTEAELRTPAPGGPDAKPGPGLPPVIKPVTPPSGGTASKDAEALKGTWEVVEMSGGGMKVPAKEADGKAITFRDGRVFLVEKGREEDAGPLRIDASKSPKTIDFTPTSGPERGKTLRGIYELKGDTLKLALGPPDGARPTTFVSPKGSQVLVFDLKRKVGAAPKPLPPRGLPPRPLPPRPLPPRRGAP